MTEALPECMRICFKSLYDMTNEISSKIYKKHGWNPINSLQKSVTFLYIFLVATSLPIKMTELLKMFINIAIIDHHDKLLFRSR